MSVTNNIETDLAKISQIGKRNEQKNLRFRSYLKGIDGNRIDRLVFRLNAEVSAQIDCTACGNCCRSLKPSLTNDDIKRLSVNQNLSEEVFIEKYIDIEDDANVFRNLPCSFLCENKCAVYENRPEDCRSFPHLDKGNFTTRLWGVLENYSICPIVFNVFERLKMELRFR